ncbi:hypothetical protein D3C84_1261210 [compost metagenome]
MLEIGRVFGRFAIQGQGVLRGGLGQAGQHQQAGTEGAQGIRHRAVSVGFSHQARSPRV